jgi:dihydroflavonol-4-reductase
MENQQKILVTGGTGLVGAHLLLRLIKQGKSVRAIYRNEASLAKAKQIFNYYQQSSIFEQIEWFKANILDIKDIEEAIFGCKTVFHCAAMISFHPKDAKQMYEINVRGTKNLVDVCLENKEVNSFVHVSSTAAVGRNAYDITTEEHIWDKNDASNYSISKKQAEIEVWRGAEEGLNVIIVNPCIIIGPGNWDEGSSKLFQKIHRGLSYFTPGANAFVDVNDVVECMIELEEKKIYNERFLLIGENLSYKNFFDLLAQNLNVRAPQKLAKKWQAIAMSYFESLRTFLTGSYPIITKETVKSSYQKTTYSNDKIIKKIGFKFTPISQSIAQTAKIFLQHQSTFISKTNR